jgi:spoIIIJ-associated protein
MEGKLNKRSAADMKVEGSGKTVSEARADALARLQRQAGPFDMDDVELVILSEGSKGFLGMGSALARVEARLIKAGDSEAAEPEGGESSPEVKNAQQDAKGKADVQATVVAVSSGQVQVAGAEAEARLENYLKKVLACMGLTAHVTVADEYDALVGNITGDDLGLFIGRHGQTIDAIQYLANIIVFRGLPNRKRVVVDAEDYRERRTEALKSLADRGANEVLRGKPQYEFKPMSAAERRIIHLHLQDRDGIKTLSEGNEPFRRVIITRSERT